jgi:hypothetical protein
MCMDGRVKLVKRVLQKFKFKFNFVRVSEKVCNVTEKLPNNVRKKTVTLFVTLYFYNVTA